MRAKPLSRDGIRRVLVRCPNWLGDTVMAVPTLHALCAALPEAEVWCLGPWVEPLLEAEPGIARRIRPAVGLGGMIGGARALRRWAMDLAVLFTSSFESALLVWLAGARWRVGYAGNGRAGLLTHPLTVPGDACHQVEAYLALLRPLGIAASPRPPQIAVRAERRTEARRLLGEIGLGSSERPVGIQLGAAFGPSKLWAVDRLAALASHLERAGTPVVFLGSPSARPLLAGVAAAMPSEPRSLVGRDSPALLPALLAECAALVAPDTGPAHVAAAVGVPVVTLFGPTDPRLTAPLGAGVALWRQPVCAPCFRSRCPIDHRCLHAVEVDDVVEAVQRQLLGAAARPTASALS